MRTIKLTISYDGTNYCGWQTQPKDTSIQQIVQRAASKLTGEEISVAAAGRTDAGVHALGQVAHFRTKGNIPAEGIMAGMNAMLPDDISIVGAEEASDSFNSRKDAKGKRYRYRIHISKRRSPLTANRAWHLDSRLDVDAMREAAAHLIGEHDFASFRASGCASRHAVRRIDAIEIVRHKALEECLSGEGEFVDIAVDGNGFVRHMVRNIVGTLVEVGKGRMDPGLLKEIVSAKDRRRAGRCAPACGLYLVKVFY